MCQLQAFLKQEHSPAVAMVHIQVETLMANNYCKGLLLKAEDNRFPPAKVDPRHNKGQGTGKIIC